MPNSGKQHRVVIVGAGFAGYHAARELSRLAGGSTEITVINSADYFLYLPLMPQLTGGLVEPRHICVSASRSAPASRWPRPATATSSCPPGRRCRPGR